jgi:hypothetical protein
MSRSALLAVVASMLLVATARATPPPSAVIEIDYLLQHLETSACEFYRNGSWYDGSHAKAHLQIKYDYLAARNLIGSTEDFIDKAASKSSLSGQPYKVRCGNAPVLESGQWFRDALGSYRAAKQSAAAP